MMTSPTDGQRQQDATQQLGNIQHLNKDDDHTGNSNNDRISSQSAAIPDTTTTTANTTTPRRIHSPRNSESNITGNSSTTTQPPKESKEKDNLRSSKYLDFADFFTRTKPRFFKVAKKSIKPDRNTGSASTSSLSQNSNSSLRSRSHSRSRCRSIPSAPSSSPHQPSPRSTTTPESTTTSSTPTLPVTTVTPPSDPPAVAPSMVPPATSASTSQRPIGGGISGIPSHAASAGRSVSMPVPRPRARTLGAPSSSLRAPHRHSMYDLDTSTHLMPNHPRHSTNPAPAAPIVAPSLMPEKPQASTSGGAVTMTIKLAEPILFLQGFDHHEFQNRAPAMLRGSLVVRVNKTTKVKAIGLTFRGKARTDWPEGMFRLSRSKVEGGIPPKKSEYFEEKELMQHTWPFFDARFPSAELGHCADSFSRTSPSSSTSHLSSKSISSTISNLARSASPSSSSSSHPLSLNLSQSRSFSKHDSSSASTPTIAQRGYRLFQPGEYIYNFELPLESCFPESIDVDLGSVKYELEGTIERPGAFRSNLIGKKEVILVRVPSEANLESSEPIAISRTWEDQLHYDIVISGKSFPLGSTIPIAFKLTPLAKVRCHRIKIYITENIEYSCKNKRVNRVDSTKKLLLLEKRAELPATSTFPGSSLRVISGGGFDTSATAGNRGGEDEPAGVDATRTTNGTDNLLGDLTGAPNIGPTEMEFNVQLPGCKVREKDRIHFDTTYSDIQVHHWIKIVMRLSKTDPADSSKRRHFEISIDSPFHILSCRATSVNTTLPEYHSAANTPLPSAAASQTCLCTQTPTPSSGGTPRRRDRDAGSRAPTAPAGPTLSHGGPGVHGPPLGMTGILPQPPPHAHHHHSSRPRFPVLRQPSLGPPPRFEAAAVMTPPPQYEAVFGQRGENEPLADYFDRLAIEEEGSTENVNAGDGNGDIVAVGESDGEDHEGENGGSGMVIGGLTRRVSGMVGEMRLPLTPGGRIARSLDESRSWAAAGV